MESGQTLASVPCLTPDGSRRHREVDWRQTGWHVYDTPPVVDECPGEGPVLWTCQVCGHEVPDLTETRERLDQLVVDEKAAAAGRKQQRSDFVHERLAGDDAIDPEHGAE